MAPPKRLSEDKLKKLIKTNSLSKPPVNPIFNPYGNFANPSFAYTPLKSNKVLEKKKKSRREERLEPTLLNPDNKTKIFSIENTKYIDNFKKYTEETKRPFTYPYLWNEKEKSYVIPDSPSTTQPKSWPINTQKPVTYSGNRFVVAKDEKSAFSANRSVSKANRGGSRDTLEMMLPGFNPDTERFQDFNFANPFFQFGGKDPNYISNSKKKPGKNIVVGDPKSKVTREIKSGEAVRKVLDYRSAQKNTLDNPPSGYWGPTIENSKLFDYTLDNPPSDYWGPAIENSKLFNIASTEDQSESDEKEKKKIDLSILGKPEDEIKSDTKNVAKNYNESLFRTNFNSSKNPLTGKADFAGVANPYGNFANPSFGIGSNQMKNNKIVPVPNEVRDFKLNVEEARLGRPLNVNEINNIREQQKIQERNYLDNKTFTAYNKLNEDSAMLNSEYGAQANAILASLGQAPIVQTTGTRKVKFSSTGKIKEIPTSNLSGDPFGVINEFNLKKSITDWALANTDIVKPIIDPNKTMTVQTGSYTQSRTGQSAGPRGQPRYYSYVETVPVYTTFTYKTASPQQRAIIENQSMYEYYGNVMDTAKKKKEAYTKIATPLEAEYDSQIAQLDSEIAPVLASIDRLRSVRYRSGSPDAVAQGRAYADLSNSIADKQAQRAQLVAARDDLIYAYAAIPQEDITKLQDYQTQLKENVGVLDKNIKTVKSAKAKLEIQLGLGAKDKTRQLLMSYSQKDPLSSFVQSITNPIDMSLQNQSSKVSGIQQEVSNLQKSYDESVGFRRTLAGMSDFLNPYKEEGGLNIYNLASDTSKKTAQLLKEADIYKAARDAMGDWVQGQNYTYISPGKVESLLNPSGVTQNVLDNTNAQLTSVQQQIAAKEKIVSDLQNTYVITAPTNFRDLDGNIVKTQFKFTLDANDATKRKEQLAFIEKSKADKNTTVVKAGDGDPITNSKLKAEAFNLQELQKTAQELTKLQKSQQKEVEQNTLEPWQIEAIKGKAADAEKAMLSSLESYTNTRRTYRESEESLRRQADILTSNLNFAIANQGRIDAGRDDPVLKAKPGAIGGFGGAGSSASTTFKIDKALVPASGKMLVEMKYSFLPQSPVGKTVYANVYSPQIGTMAKTVGNYDYVTGESNTRTALVEVPVDQDGNIKLDFRVDGEDYHKTSKKKKRYIDYGGSLNIMDVKVFSPNQEKMLLDTGLSYLQQESAALAAVQAKKQATTSAKSFLEGTSDIFTTPTGVIATYTGGNLDIKNPDEFKSYFGGLVDSKVFESTRQVYPVVQAIKSKRDATTSNISRVETSLAQDPNAVRAKMQTAKFNDNIDATPNPNAQMPGYHWKDWRNQRSNEERDMTNMLASRYPNVSSAIISAAVQNARAGERSNMARGNVGGIDLNTVNEGVLNSIQSEYNSLRNDYKYTSDTSGKGLAEIQGYKSDIYNLDNFTKFVTGTAPKLLMKVNGEEKEVAERLQTGEVSVIDQGLFGRYGISVPNIASSEVPKERIDALESQIQGQTSSFDELYAKVKELGRENTEKTSNARIASIMQMKRKGLISGGQANKQINEIKQNRTLILDAIAKDEYLPDISEFDQDEIADYIQIKEGTVDIIKKGLKEQAGQRLRQVTRSRKPSATPVGQVLQIGATVPRPPQIEQTTTLGANMGRLPNPFIFDYD